MLLLNRDDVTTLLSLPDCIAAVEEVMGQHAQGALPLEPGVLGAHVPLGGFHVKTAAISGSPGYFAAKVNANVPENPRTTGLPTIQGLLALFETGSGRPLALLDSIEITALRTAAATAVAARYLARAEAATVTICGCGNQGRSHLRALTHVRPIAHAFALDLDPDRARRFAEELGPELGLTISPTESLAAAVAASDICITCTPAHAPVFPATLLHPGLFLGAIGADSPDKQELEPAVLRRGRVVVDILEQAATMGDLHHAIAAGVMAAADVHATLGQIIDGQRAGRTAAEEISVFDSTGTALQDVVASALVYERAQRTGRGVRFAFAG